MALVKTSIGVAAISGKVGGNIFSRSKSGQTLKSAQRATQVRSIASVARRSVFSYISRLWSGFAHSDKKFSIVKDSHFDEDINDWNFTGGTLVQNNGIGTLEKSPPPGLAYFYQFLDFVQYDNYTCQFSYIPVAGFEPDELRVYLYNPDTVDFYWLRNYFDPTLPFTETINFKGPSAGYRITVIITGLSVKASFDFVTVYPNDKPDPHSWQHAATNFPYQNRIGENRLYSGFNLFSKFSLNLLALNESVKFQAPIPSDLEIVQINRTRAALTYLDIELTGAIADPNLVFLVYATRSMPPTVTRFKPQEMKLLIPTPVINVDTIECVDEHAAIFGYKSLMPDNIVFIRLCWFDKRTGENIAKFELPVPIV